MNQLERALEHLKTEKSRYARQLERTKKDMFESLELDSTGYDGYTRIDAQKLAHLQGSIEALRLSIDWIESCLEEIKY